MTEKPYWPTKAESRQRHLESIYEPGCLEFGKLRGWEPGRPFKLKALARGGNSNGCWSFTLDPISFPIPMLLWRNPVRWWIGKQPIAVTLCPCLDEMHLIDLGKWQGYLAGHQLDLSRGIDYPPWDTSAETALFMISKVEGEGNLPPPSLLGSNRARVRDSPISCLLIVICL